MVLWEIVLEFVWLLLFGIDSKYVYVAQMKVLKKWKQKWRRSSKYFEYTLSLCVYKEWMHAESFRN